jgi:hypothetical protein
VNTTLWMRRGKSGMNIGPENEAASNHSIRGCR